MKKYLWLPFILISAAFFRFYGLGWGLPYSLHIDERNVLAVAANLARNIQEQGSFNPHFSAYGALLFYLLLPLKFLLAASQLLYGSRFAAALLGTLTVYFTYALGEKFKNQLVGLLAGLFTALSVILWRESHFYTAETPLLLFIVLALGAGLDILRAPQKKSYCYFAVFLGLAISVKSIALLLVVPLLFAHLGSQRGFGNSIRSLRAPAFWLTLLAAAGIFLVLNPFCILDPAYWRQNAASDLMWNALMVSGAALPPWAVQFLDRTRGLYELTGLYPWAVGWPLLLAALAGLLAALIKKEARYYFMLSWILPYLLLTSSWQVKFIRYTIPLVPVLNILAADWLLNLKWAKLKMSLILLVVLGTFCYSAAYLNVYRQNDSRVEASRYLSEVAGGKVVVSEVDEGFLLADFYPEKQLPFREINLDLFYQNQQPRLRQKLINDALREADYLVVSSNNYSRFARLPQHFPDLAQYYQALFKERLGFKKLVSFKHYPEFLGFTINDDPAELTFQLFDHPRITIFQKANRHSKQLIL